MTRCRLDCSAIYGGCVKQRTTVVIDLDDDGRYTHRLSASGDG